MVRRTIFHHLPDPRTQHFVVVRLRLRSTPELTGDRLLFIHKQHHDVHRRLTKMDA